MEEDVEINIPFHRLSVVDKRHARRFDRALKTKDLSALLEEESDDFDENFSRDFFGVNI